jgi:DNA polymerase III subunit delta'
MQYSQVVGQADAKSGLLHMWQSNLFPHAILILGAEGLGGLPMAIATAQFLFCENKQENDSCGVCVACKKVSKLEHADLHLSFPVVKFKSNEVPLSRHFIKEFKEFVKQTPYGTTYDWLQFINAENKQGAITAEECRDIIANLNLKSYEGGKKVQLIWRPEYFSQDGKIGNVLLKLIEEPPQDTIIILVAENIEDILMTIRSRTQLVKLVPIHAGEVTNALQQRLDLDGERARQIAYICGGSYTEALRLARSAENDLYPSVRKLFQALLKDRNVNGVEASAFVEEWSKAGREQQKNILLYIIHLLENALVVYFNPKKEIPLSEKEANLVRYLGASAGIGFEQIQMMAKAVAETEHFIERNAHAKTQLLALVIRLGYIIRNKPVLQEN